MVFNVAVLILRFANPEMPINVFVCKTQLLNTDCVFMGEQSWLMNISGKKNCISVYSASRPRM